MTMPESSDLYRRLKAIGALPDDAVDPAQTALLLAGLNHPGLSLERYSHHLVKTADAVKARHGALLAAGAKDDAGTRLAALKHVIADGQGMTGDRTDGDNIENADLVRVIDRRRGMPIALSILYLDAGRRQGWAVQGLNFPGHFLLRMDKDGARIVFDPFNDCHIMQAPDLRDIVKRHVGPDAELSASYYEPCSNRQTVLRLQNNIKLRLIRAEDDRAALDIVQAMRLVAPAEYRLLLDAGVLYARTGQADAAIEVLESYLDLAPDDCDRHDAAALLQYIKNGMT